MRKTTSASAALLSLLILLSAACRRPQDTGSTAARVANPNLGLAIAMLPEPFEVVSADGDTIELHAPGSGGDGRVVISVGEPDVHGVNLIDEVKARKTAFEGLPGGVYLGNRELGTPTGTAFTARGTYDGETGPAEETWVYSLHPLERDRLLTLVYTYPAGESERRINELLLLLGEIEGAAGMVDNE